MRKRFALILFFIHMVLSTVLLSSCSDGTEGAVGCISCTDTDHNEKCDVCGGYVQPENPPHTECYDENSDGICDECTKKLENIPNTDPITPLSLIEDGKINFSLVVSDELSGDVRKRIDDFSRQITLLGGKMDVYSDTGDSITDGIEVLIGKVVSRGDKYAFDGWDYGYKGYSVKVEDEKIIIVGGNDTVLISAIDYFSKDILGIDEKTKKLRDAVFSREDQIEYYHEYKVSSLSVNGRDMKDYVIATDPSDSTAVAMAREARNIIFRYTGYNLKIESSLNVSDKYILISHRERSGGEGFYVKTVGQNIEIISEFPCKSKESVSAYFLKLALATGDAELLDFTLNTRDVRYDDYGAVGDGKTDDVEAIRAAHIHANECGHTVVATDGAKYYIGAINSGIVAETDTNFGSAEFIIDDRGIMPDSKEASVQIFTFRSTSAAVRFTPENCELIRELNKNGGIDSQSIKKLDLGLGYPAMLEVYNSNHKVYIRTYLTNDGDDQRELVIVDAEGNIDPSTPFLLDYDKITEIIARPIDAAPITVEGGRFITRVPQVPETYQNYVSRGIVISRANTTVKNLTHKITDEQETGNPYGGFLNIWRGVNITVEGCSFMSHKTYRAINSLGINTTMGSYDIAIQGSNNVRFINCTQSNFFKNEDELLPYFSLERWGIMGSNYSKNIHYENCRLSRLDAHCGVYNASLKGCEVVYVSVVGGGDLRIEDTTVYNNEFINLRGDYGSTWKGNIYVKNVRLVNTDAPTFFNASFTNHYYGYKTYLPKNIYIDGFEIYRGNSIAMFPDKLVNAGNIGDPMINGVKNENPLTPTERIEIINNYQNIEFILPDTDFFSDIELIIR